MIFNNYDYFFERNGKNIGGNLTLIHKPGVMQNNGDMLRFIELSGMELRF